MKKKQTLQASSIFWKGENPGDTISGKFIAWQMTNIGNLAMKLELPDKTTKIVGMTTVLFNLFKDHHNMKPGTPVVITFEQRVKRAMIYRAEVGGKKLSSAFPDAKQDEVDAFFKSGYQFKESGKGKGKK